MCDQCSNETGWTWTSPFGADLCSQCAGMEARNMGCERHTPEGAIIMVDCEGCLDRKPGYEHIQGERWCIQCMAVVRTGDIECATCDSSRCRGCGMTEGWAGEEFTLVDGHLWCDGCNERAQQDEVEESDWYIPYTRT